MSNRQGGDGVFVVEVYSINGFFDVKYDRNLPEFLENREFICTRCLFVLVRPRARSRVVWQQLFRLKGSEDAHAQRTERQHVSLACRRCVGVHRKAAAALITRRWQHSFCRRCQQSTVPSNSLLSTKSRHRSPALGVLRAIHVRTHNDNNNNKTQMASSHTTQHTHFTTRRQQKRQRNTLASSPNTHVHTHNDNNDSETQWHHHTQHKHTCTTRMQTTDHFYNLHTHSHV
jgi:hypothetical protein